MKNLALTVACFTTLGPFAICVAVGGRGIVSGATPPAYQSTAIVAAMVARGKKLQNLAVTYRLKVAYAAPAGRTAPPSRRLQRGVRRGPIWSGTFRYRGRFDFLGGLYARFTELMGKRSFMLARTRQATFGSVCRIYTPQRFERLLYHEPLVHGNGGKPLGEIDDPHKTLPRITPLAYALALRPFDHRWLNPGAFRKAEIKPLGGDYMMILRTGDVYVNEWTFSPQRDYGITHYEMLLREGGKLVENASIDCSAFKVIDGIRLPGKIVARALTSNGAVAWTKTLTDIRYRIGDPKNVPSRYIMLWPKGSVVMDARIHKVFFIRNKPQTLTDEQIYKLLHGAKRPP